MATFSCKESWETVLFLGVSSHLRITCSVTDQEGRKGIEVGNLSEIKYLLRIKKKLLRITQFSDDRD